MLESIKPYSNGLFFTQKLAENLDDQKTRVDQKKATMLIIDGSMGEGKTTLAVHVADYLQGEPIDFDSQLAMGGDDFKKKLALSYRLGKKVIIYDEAGDFNRRGAITKFNSDLNRVFETYRTFKIIVILVLPSFSVLDNDLFTKGIPRLLIHCHDRSKNNGHYKGYSLYRMYFLREKIAKFTVKPYAYQNVEPNFHGHFKDLHPDRSASLDSISTEAKLSILEKKLEGKNVSAEELVTTRDIAEYFNFSIKRAANLAIDMKLVPVKVEKKWKYYSASVLDEIETSMQRHRK